MTNKTYLSTNAQFILDDIDELPDGHHLESASEEQILTAIRALEDGEYLAHMGYTDDDTPYVEEAYGALQAALENF